MEDGKTHWEGAGAESATAGDCLRITAALFPSPFELEALVPPPFVIGSCAGRRRQGRACVVERLGVAGDDPGEAGHANM